MDESDFEDSSEALNPSDQQQPSTNNNMNQSDLKCWLETLNLSDQQQPSSQYLSANNRMNELVLANDPAVDLGLLDDLMPSFFDPHDNSEPLDINGLINPSDESSLNDYLLDTQLSMTFCDEADLSSIINAFQKEEPLEHHSGISEQQQNFCQSQFVECFDSLNFYPNTQSNTSLCSIAVGSSPLEPQVEESLRACLQQQDRIYQQSSKTKSRKSQRTNKVNHDSIILNSGGCQPCTTAQMHNDYAYQQPLLENKAVDSKNIHIHCQPRSKFRPRTQNESKAAAHYLRCEDGIKPEYPTIGIPRHWMFESDVNLIEVALMGLDKQPHPYSLDNKTCSNTYEDNTLIFKQGDPNVLYFRLTNEDYQNEYKTFMIELIKSKQDEIITKEYIRTRKLEQSMLRFTRFFQVGKGDFQRDEGSTVYSTVMTEAYGDVEVEHIDPQYGPMSGQKMVYIVLKGRILKNDLKIEISVPSIYWTYTVENFTKNGNVLYFLMPAFPYPSPQCETIKAYITVYYKNEEIHQVPYLYIGTLDHYLSQLSINEPNTQNASPSLVPNGFDALSFLSSINARPNPSSRRSSTPKIPKRLKKKGL